MNHSFRIVKGTYPFDYGGLCWIEEHCEGKDSNLPVMLMTGYSHAYSAESAIAARAREFITKPFSIQEFIIRFDEMMCDHRGEEPLPAPKESAMRWAKLAFGPMVKNEKMIFVVPKELEVEINAQSIIEKGIFTKQEIIGMGNPVEQELKT